MAVLVLLAAAAPARVVAADLRFLALDGLRLGDRRGRDLLARRRHAPPRAPRRSDRLRFGGRAFLRAVLLAVRTGAGAGSCAGCRRVAGAHALLPRLHAPPPLRLE